MAPSATPTLSRVDGRAIAARRLERLAHPFGVGVRRSASAGSDPIPLDAVDQRRTPIGRAPPATEPVDFEPSITPKDAAERDVQPPAPRAPGHLGPCWPSRKRYSPGSALSRRARSIPSAGLNPAAKPHDYSTGPQARLAGERPARRRPSGAPRPKQRRGGRPPVHPIPVPLMEPHDLGERRLAWRSAVDL